MSDSRQRLKTPQQDEDEQPYANPAPLGLKTSISEIEPAESTKSEERASQQPADSSEGPSYGYFPHVTSMEQKSVFTRESFLVAAAAVLGFLVFRYYTQDQHTWSSGTQRMWTKEQLSSFTGEPAGTAMYLAIVGEVYDVSRGDKFYSAEGGYGFFTGKDASKAFVTGEFKDDLTDDVSELQPEQCLGLVEWRSFYRRTYTPMGLLIGNFYDAAGQPTAALQQLEACAQEGQELKAAKEKAEQELPGCNMRWSEAAGGAVWCDDEMYPRKVFQQLPGGQPNTRCACFKEIGWSDYRQLYPDCKPDAHECQTAPPASAA